MWTKEEYRNQFRSLAGQANMRELLKKLDISQWNYYDFLRGDDNRLSVKKCEAIRIELENTPAIQAGKTKDQYRELFQRYSYYLNMTRLLKDFGISQGNYSAFMSGDNSKLSYKKCEIIFKIIENIYITIENMKIQLNEY